MGQTAVVLAAGLGSRLKERTKNRPKGLLEVGGKPLLVRSIETLRAFGVDRFLIGTGYLSEQYEALFSDDPTIRCVRNDHYFSSGSMYTLYVLRKLLNDDFLLVESDLIYERRALDKLQRDRHKDVVLASGKTSAGDEVYVEVNRGGMLTNLSKDPTKISSVFGEFVGISKISKECATEMNRIAEETFSKRDLHLEYEQVLVKTGRVRPVSVLKIDDLVWAEIDDESHLQRVESSVLPKIESAEHKT